MRAEDLVIEHSLLFRKLSKEKIGFITREMLEWAADDIFTKLAWGIGGGHKKLRDYGAFFKQEDFPATPGWQIFRYTYERNFFRYTRLMGEHGATDSNKFWKNYSGVGGR